MSSHNANDLVSVTMTKQDVARAWCAQHNLVIIDRHTIDGLAEIYRQHLKDSDASVLVYDPEADTYRLISQADWRKAQKKVDDAAS